MPIPFNDEVVLVLILGSLEERMRAIRCEADYRLFLVELRMDFAFLKVMRQLQLRVQLLNLASAVSEVAMWTCCLGSLMLSGMTLADRWNFQPVTQYSMIA